MTAAAAKWGWAFALVLCLHVGGIGASLIHWGSRSAQELSLPPPALMIDLAETPSGQEDIAEEPELIEEPEQPEPVPEPEPVVEPEPIEPPEVPDPPVVEEAEAVLAEVPEEAVPMLTEQAEPTKPVAATVEKKKEIVQGPEPGPPAAPAKSVSNQAVLDAKANWQARVLGHLEARKRYPYIAQRKRQEGIVYVRFVMDREGRVLARQLEQGVRSDELNEEAINLIKRAEPLPAPPVDVPGETIELVLPIRFSIR